MVDFIDANRGDVVEGRKLGVEPICRVLQVAPSLYYAAKTRPASVRSQRDAVTGPAIVALWHDNYRVYGARKLWKAAKRAGHDVGRDQVARLMRTAGIEGVTRTKRVRTTKRDPGAPRHPDLVDRDFTATGPNQLWVTDLTYVPTWAGVAYVCFITDVYSRRIVGWRAAPHMRTTMVLDAIEMARWSRGTNLQGLRCHSDAGSQFTSIRYGERLAEIGAVPSIGTVGDSYDNALAETVNGYYKAELIRGPARDGRPWKTVEDVELATLSWVHWHNTQRLHGYLGDVSPAEFEETFYARARTDQPLVEIQ
jgi:putative transposase